LSWLLRACHVGGAAVISLEVQEEEVGLPLSSGIRYISPLPVVFVRHHLQAQSNIPEGLP
jgi:hypothetical protein